MHAPKPEHGLRSEHVWRPEDVVRQGQSLCLGLFTYTGEISGLSLGVGIVPVRDTAHDTVRDTSHGSRFSEGGSSFEGGGSSSGDAAMVTRTYDGPEANACRGCKALYSLVPQMASGGKRTNSVCTVCHTVQAPLPGIMAAAAVAASASAPTAVSGIGTGTDTNPGPIMVMGVKSPALLKKLGLEAPKLKARGKAKVGLDTGRVAGAGAGAGAGTSASAGASTELGAETSWSFVASGADRLVHAVRAYLGVCGVSDEDMPSVAAVAPLVFVALAKLGACIPTREPRAQKSGDTKVPRATWVQHYEPDPDAAPGLDQVQDPASGSGSGSGSDLGPEEALQWSPALVGAWCVGDPGPARYMSLFADGFRALATPAAKNTEFRCGAVAGGTVLAAVAAYILGPGAAHANVSTEALQHALAWAGYHPDSLPLGLMKSIVDGLAVATERMPESQPGPGQQWAALVSGLSPMVVHRAGLPWYPVISSGAGAEAGPGPGWLPDGSCIMDGVDAAAAAAAAAEFVFTTAPPRFVAAVRLLGVLDAQCAHVCTNSPLGRACGATPGVFTSSLLYALFRLWVAAMARAPAMGSPSALVAFLLMVAWQLNPNLEGASPPLMDGDAELASIVRLCGLSERESSKGRAGTEGAGAGGGGCGGGGSSTTPGTGTGAGARTHAVVWWKVLFRQQHPRVVQTICKLVGTTPSTSLKKLQDVVAGVVTVARDVRCGLDNGVGHSSAMWRFVCSQWPVLQGVAELGVDYA